MHIHNINLEKFQSCFDTLNYTLKSLEQYEIADEFKNILQIRFNRLLENYFKIKRVKRVKRGLINPLGTVLKAITGNADNTDLVEIQNALSKTRNKINSLLHNNERQIVINTELQNKLNLLIEKFNENQIQILKNLSNHKNQLSHKDVLIKQTVHNALFNIELLETQLKDIFEAVQLARLGIISKNILSSKETTLAFEILEQQNVEIDYIDQLYEYLNVQVFHNQSNLIFVIKIPLFHRDNFTFIQFEALPKNNRVINLS